MKFKIFAVFAVLITMVGAFSAIKWRSSETGIDFRAYYVAACLVRDGLSEHIYDVVDQGTNPQLLLAGPETVFAQTARAHGISQSVLYVYPPTLADLIVPFTALSPIAALMFWHGIELLLIAGLSVVLTRMLGIKFRGATILVAAAILLFRPTLNTIHFGQASIFLAFAMTVGLACYVRGKINTAAFLFALAVAVKLEPIIIIIPFLVWRDWKVLRNMALWGVCLGALLWLVNGGYALNLYFLHQLPAMSAGDLGGAAFDGNRSIGNIVYTVLHGAHPLLSRNMSAWTVRIICVLILCCAGWQSRLVLRDTSVGSQQFQVGLMFLLLICSLSPYSWFYNWALAIPAVILFSVRVWDGKADTMEVSLLIMLLLSLSTSKFNMPMITPLIGTGLGLVGLHRIRLGLTGTDADRRTVEWNAVAQ